MKELLDSLYSKPVTIYCRTLSGAIVAFNGILHGGSNGLPGQPYNVSYTHPINPSLYSSIDFMPDNVDKIDIRSNQNIIYLK